MLSGYGPGGAAKAPVFEGELPVWHHPSPPPPSPPASSRAPPPPPCAAPSPALLATAQQQQQRAAGLQQQQNQHQWCRQPGPDHSTAQPVARPGLFKTRDTSFRILLKNTLAQKKNRCHLSRRAWTIAGPKKRA